MGNSYISSYIHYIFSIKNHKKYLSSEIRERLFPYIGGICKENNLRLIKAGGVLDHVHLLVSLSSTIAIAKAIQYIKGGSSKWIHETYPDMKDFSWQEGYGAFSISISQIERTIKYILNQENHHRKKTFREEFIEILKYHQIEFDERYLV